MTNSIPFEDARSDVDIVERILRRQLPSLNENTHLPVIDDLCFLMNMCWEYDPADRPTAKYCRESTERMLPGAAPDTQSDPSLPIRRLRELGSMYQSRGEHAKALDFLVRAVQASRIHGSRETLVSSLRDLARLHQLRKEYSKAIALYSEIEADPGRNVDVAGDLCNLALLHRLQNKHNKAIGQSTHSRDIKEEERIAKALWNLAVVYRQQNDTKKAIQFYSEVLQIRTDLDDNQGRADALLGLADVHKHSSQYDQAIRLYSEALVILTTLGDGRGRADALLRLAAVHRLRGKHDNTTLLYTEVVRIFTDLGDKGGRADALRRLAEVRHLEQQPGYRLYEKGGADAFYGFAEVYRYEPEYAKPYGAPFYGAPFVSRPATPTDNRRPTTDERQPTTTTAGYTGVGKKRARPNSWWGTNVELAKTEPWEYVVPAAYRSTADYIS
ncbi:hypothetical protein FRC00_003855 [Tulasnella sp. 408]|nr:hypothetical protein FRC00_003855 [Tulasnella sp. 408]